MKLRIKTDGLINIRNGLISPPSLIKIKDGIIESISPLNETDDVPDENIETIDAMGKFVLPGLIDSHLHLNFSGSDSPLDEMLSSDDETLYDMSLKNARIALQNGITTVRDCGSKGDTCLRLRNDILTGRVTGPNVLTSGRAITTRGGHVYFAGIEANTAEEVFAAAEELFSENVNFFKVIISGGNMTPGSNPLIDQYGSEEISALVNFANAHNKKVSAHIHTSEGMRKAFETGVHIIEHGSWRKGDGIDIDGNILNLMAQNGTAYCTALPSIYSKDPETLYTKKEDIEKLRKLQKDRIEATVRNIQSGMTTILGTDAGTKGNGPDELVNHAALIHRVTGLSCLDVIKMMTLNPAEVLELKSRGSLEKGKVADILIVKENPLVKMENLKMIHSVIKSGEAVFMQFQ